MKNYIQLTRPLNLLFIIFMMLLFRYAFVLPKFYTVYNFTPALNQIEYIILIIITVLTAASGYVINDIYDSDIDNINKPEKVIIEKSIQVDDAYNFYKIICLVATLLTILLAVLSKNIKLATVPIIILVALNFYAQYFKKQLLVGNFLIAIFASFVILLPTIYESSTENEDATIRQIQSGIFGAGLCYAIFAFFITLLREIVKDMQDVEGDRMYGCKSVPIQLGFTVAKIINTIVLIIIGIFIFSFTVFFNHIEIKYINIFIYLLLLLPLLAMLILNWFATVKKHFSWYSAFVKIYMFLGVSTMIYFIYTSGSASYLFMEYFKFLNNILN